MKDTVSFESFAGLEMRAGTIVSFEPVPKSSKLIKFEISFGQEIGNRTILSGIGPVIDPGATGPGSTIVEGMRVVAILNFAPRSMMGIESSGMLLSSKNESGKFFLLSPGLVSDGTAVG
jgi:methionyl-tRNA synthetase